MLLLSYGIHLGLFRELGEEWGGGGRGKGDMGMGMGMGTCTTRVEEREIFLYIAVLAFHQWRVSLGPLALSVGNLNLALYLRS